MKAYLNIVGPFVVEVVHVNCHVTDEAEVVKRMDDAGWSCKRGGALTVGGIVQVECTKTATGHAGANTTKDDIRRLLS